MAGNFHNELDNVFNVEGKREVIPVEEESHEIIEYVRKEDDEKLEEDFNYARDNLKEVLEASKKALMSYCEVVERSETPSAIQVLGEFLQRYSEVNKQLFDIHSRKNDLKTFDDKISEPKTVNNNLNITTNALLELVKKGARGELD